MTAMACFTKWADLLLKLGLGTTPVLVWFKDCWGCSLGLESLLVLLLKLQKTDDDVRVNLLFMTYKGEFLEVILILRYFWTAQRSLLFPIICKVTKESNKGGMKSRVLP